MDRGGITFTLSGDLERHAVDPHQQRAVVAGSAGAGNDEVLLPGRAALHHIEFAATSQLTQGECP
jgi:hypothetical protein